MRGPGGWTPDHYDRKEWCQGCLRVEVENRGDTCPECRAAADEERAQLAKERRTSCGCPVEHETISEWEDVHGEIDMRM